MAVPIARERLNPSLLDRLCDNEPGKQVEARESRYFSDADLRDSVLRDLNWLFNATQHEDAMFKDHPAIQQSVLNFGIPALAGRPSSALRMRGVEESLRRSIVEFEPRLNPESVRVRAESGGDGQSSHNVVSFRIEAQLWAQPYPLALLLRTELDLESGASRVLETSGG